MCPQAARLTKLASTQPQQKGQETGTQYRPKPGRGGVSPINAEFLSANQVLKFLS